jgi:hypothetical protein
VHRSIPDAVSAALEASVPGPEPAAVTLDDAIADAQARGDWQLFDELNTRKLREVRERTDTNGQLRPPAPPPTSATAVPAGSFDGGARPPAPPPRPLDEQIAEAEARGDWRTHADLSARKLAEAVERRRARDLGL